MTATIDTGNVFVCKENRMKTYQKAPELTESKYKLWGTFTYLIGEYYWRIIGEIILKHLIFYSRPARSVQYLRFAKASVIRTAHLLRTFFITSCWHA